jgi:protein CLEC16A
MFDVLTEIFSRSKEKDIINAILGFFTMLLTNLSRKPSVNYLLSHPSIASLQLTKFGNMGNEVADYYINFLKVLSRKITIDNIQLFFNKKYSSFPILSQTIRFFNHP